MLCRVRLQNLSTKRVILCQSLLTVSLYSDFTFPYFLRPGYVRGLPEVKHLIQLVQGFIKYSTLSVGGIFWCISVYDRFPKRKLPSSSRELSQHRQGTQNKIKKEWEGISQKTFKRSTRCSWIRPLKVCAGLMIPLTTAQGYPPLCFPNHGFHIHTHPIIPLELSIRYSSR